MENKRVKVPPPSFIVNHTVLNRRSVHLEFPEFKELSKKDLSKEMFGAGVYLGIQAFIDSMSNPEQNKKG